MKLWLWIGFLSAVTAQAAFASEVAACSTDPEHGVGEQSRIASQLALPIEGAACPDAPIATLLVRSLKESLMTPEALAERERVRAHTRKHPRTLQAGVPDSVLIDGSGAL